MRDVEETVSAALSAHPAVARVEFCGSRSRDEHNELSDWDFCIETRNFAALAADLPRIVSQFKPLGALWEPYAKHKCYMFILPGPTKVDLVFNEPQTHAGPYTVRSDNLRLIDMHFWDWITWLMSKWKAGNNELLKSHFGLMFSHMLGPLGVQVEPDSLSDAVMSYLLVRDGREAEFGLRLPRELGDEVCRALHENGLDQRAP
jgi:hypothetical protein